MKAIVLMLGLPETKMMIVANKKRQNKKKFIHWRNLGFHHHLGGEARLAQRHKADSRLGTFS
jgi:hypothetical protein